MVYYHRIACASFSFDPVLRLFLLVAVLFLGHVGFLDDILEWCSIALGFLALM